MKRVLAAFACILFGATSFAQPTITGAANNPVAGEVFYGHACDTTGANRGAAGAGVTWDLSGLTVYQQDTSAFVSCSSTPYCDSFPGSNIAISDGFGGYTYFITDAAKWAVNGYGSATATDNQHFSDPENIVSFPMTYNTVKADTYSSAQPGIPWYSSGIDSFIADGYGTLILPSGSHTNVLRVRTITYSNDSDGSTAAMHVRSERYMWFTPGFHFPLLVMTYDTSGGTPYLYDVTYYTGGTTAVNDINNSAAKLKVYPNPARGTINIACTSPSDQAATIILTDITGHAVWSSVNERLSGGVNNFSYSTGSLPSGIYLLRVQAGDTAMTEKVTVIK